MPQMETLPARTWTTRVGADPLTRAESLAAIRETLRVDGWEALPLLRLEYTFSGERFDTSGVRFGWIVGSNEDGFTFEDEAGECVDLEWDEADDLRRADTRR